jgi:hypothetical protein
MNATRVDQVLAADETNSKTTPKLIANLHPAALDHFESTAEMFRLLLKKFDEQRDAQDSVLSQHADEIGVSADQLATRLRENDPTVDQHAADGFLHLRALRVVRLFILATQRYWSWGATDFYRLRITPAVGYLRLECEACALATLSLQDPSLAIRWQSLATKEEGKKFFRDTQGRVLSVLESLNLKGVYDTASGGSQHVRMTSVVRAMPDGGEVTLKDQELDPEDPYSYHLALAYFHRMQNRVLFGFGQALAIINDPEWRDAMAAFEKTTNMIWSVLQKRYEKQIAAGTE